LSVGLSPHKTADIGKVALSELQGEKKNRGTCTKFREMEP
jgi:hypothetical protein